MEDGKLISCAEEPILNLYNIEEKHLSIHQKIDVLSNIPDDFKKKFKYIYNATELINKELAICCSFPVIIFYGYHPLKELYEFKYYIHEPKGSSIRSFLQINENQIILMTWKSSGCGTSTRILLCDLKEKKINEKPIITHNGKGSSICKLSENYLAIAALKSVLIIDLKKLKKIYEYILGDYFIYNLSLFGNYLFCGCSDGSIYKYIVNDAQLVLKDKINEQNKPIIALIKCNKNTIMISLSKSIIIYDVSKEN